MQNPSPYPPGVRPYRFFWCPKDGNELRILIDRETAGGACRLHSITPDTDQFYVIFEIRPPRPEPVRRWRLRFRLPFTINFS